MILLSIVCVVKDDQAGLDRTLHSLIHSNEIEPEHLQEFEVVIVDGSESAIDPTNYDWNVNYLWEAPTGIYPAMNTGLRLAKGQYIYFLNAGDEIAAPETFNKLLNDLRDLESNNPGCWLFGPIEIVSKTGGKTITPQWDYQKQKANLFSRGHFPSHQGTVMRVSQLRATGGFNVRFTVAADYAAFLAISQISDPVIVDYPLARFFEGGTSTKQWKKAASEFHAARRQLLAPTGLDSIKERYFTAVKYTKEFIYREILSARR